MAGSANTSECCPSYQLRQYHSLSAITNELKALHVRIIVAAKVGVPQHVLPRRPRKLEGHHQHRAAQVAHAIGKYRPQLRAQATSAAVGASTPLHAYRPALANSATWCPPRTSDGEIRDREASSCSSKSENVSGAGESRDAKLPEGLSTDVDMGWVSMVTVTMPRFYRLYRAVPKIPPEKRQGNAANGGLYSSMDHGRDSNGARSSEYSEDLCRVLIDIRRHLAQNPAGDIAQRLLESCPYARCETTASRPFTLQTIYTGVADNDLAGVPGRAAVLIGLHGALAMVEGIGEDPCSPENSPKENDRSSRSSSCSGMVQCHSEREAHLRSAMVLADALLQHRGAGTLTLPEMRCFVTIITQMQPSVMLHLTGAAATSRAVATTSLELLLALARTLAAWPMFGTAEFEKKHWELSRVLLLQHQAGIKAAMVEAEDLHTQRPLRFIDLYVRGFYTSITSNEVPSLDPKSARPSSGPSLGCTATSGDGSRGCPGGGRLEGTRGDPHWIAEHMMKLFLRRCGSPGGGRGLPLRLSSAMHEEERTELTRMLLAAAMDGCRHSLVAVGGSTMKTVLTSIAALGCFRENSAKMVAAFIDTAAMAALAMDKARDGIRQGPLADNASSEPSAAFSLQIYEAAANGLKRATSCSSGSSNGSGSSRSSSTWRSGSINNSNGSSAGGIPYADGPSPSGVLGEGLLGLRLMTSAQLVVQHCPEAALFARKSETTMETGAPHNGISPWGRLIASSSSWTPSGFPRAYPPWRRSRCCRCQLLCRTTSRWLPRPKITASSQRECVATRRSSIAQMFQDSPSGYGVIMLCR
ncbi:hypothetical protein Vretimale_15607 [Volvox reticuliferus]|uniref:Uncharacterized protein n=2 Tax=Volvox reticuliferus TaxID=1737510 RepID=A0A8J4LV79_9CHLO|nr:hypothetical protein Vretimale_15607 [Volvox reticuliferus]